MDPLGALYQKRLQRAAMILKRYAKRYTRAVDYVVMPLAPKGQAFDVMPRERFNQSDLRVLADTLVRKPIHFYFFHPNDMVMIHYTDYCGQEQNVTFLIS